MDIPNIGTIYELNYVSGSVLTCVTLVNTYVTLWCKVILLVLYRYVYFIDNKLRDLEQWQELRFRLNRFVWKPKLFHPIEEDTIHLLKSEVFVWLFSAVCYYAALSAGAEQGLLLIVGVSFSQMASLMVGAPSSGHAGFRSCVCVPALRVCALGSAGSVLVVLVLHLELLRDMWDLPGPVMEPMIPALAGRFLTPAPPGKSSQRFCDCSLTLYQGFWHYWHLGGIIFVVGSGSVYCGMFRGIPGFYPLDVISSHPLPGMTMKNVFRLCHIWLTPRRIATILSSASACKPLSCHCFRSGCSCV